MTWKPGGYIEINLKPHENLYDPPDIWGDVFNSQLYPNLSLPSSLSYATGYSGHSYGLSGGTSNFTMPFESNFIKSKKCSYCGNVYQLETIKNCYNCPTCAGGWDA